jgi:hypothetical protein
LCGHVRIPERSLYRLSCMAITEEIIQQSDKIDCKKL